MQHERNNNNNNNTTRRVLSETNHVKRWSPVTQTRAHSKLSNNNNKLDE